MRMMKINGKKINNKNHQKMKNKKMIIRRKIMKINRYKGKKKDKPSQMLMNLNN